MSTSLPLRYRAFLSYSHRDTRAAKRLHARLEGFRVDKDIMVRPRRLAAKEATHGRHVQLRCGGGD